MSELFKSGNESDVSSNSSWTILDETSDEANKDDGQPRDNTSESPAENKEFVTVTPCDVIEEITEIEQYAIESPEVTEDEESDERKQGCPTLDEYLRDREIIHDYGYDERAEKWEQRLERRKHKKNKKEQRSEFFSALKLMTAFLSIAGLTFACLLLPHGSSPNSLESPAREYYRGHYQKTPNVIDFPKKTPHVKIVKPLDAHAFKEQAKNIEADLQKAMKHVHRHAHEDNNGLVQGPVNQEKSEVVKPEPQQGNVLDELKRIGKKLVRTVIPRPEPKDGKDEGSSGKSSDGLFIKTNLYLALHILNDLVLLKATGQLRKDIQEKVKTLKKRAQVKRCRKLLRFHKTSTGLQLPMNATTLGLISKSGQKPAKVIFSVESKKQTKELFKELPFLHRRVPKCNGEKLDRVKKSTDIASHDKPVGFFDFLQELQNVKSKKHDLIKSLNLKARKQYLKDEKESRGMDKFYLANTYGRIIDDARLSDQMLYCLAYLHARKRDLSTLIAKTDVSEIIMESPRYHQFLVKLFQLEDEIVKHFQQKSEFVRCDKAYTSCEVLKPNFEISAVVDLILARRTGALVKLPKKDASTSRYIVPLSSNTTLPASPVININDVPKINLQAPPTTTTDVIKTKLESLKVQNLTPIKVTDANSTTKISMEKLEVLKTWKEKYEQLRMFWRSRQEYYDKRVQICDMIKDIIPKETPSSSQGVEIIDTIIKEGVVNDTETDLIDNVLSDIKMVYEQEDRKAPGNASWCNRAEMMYQKLFERKAKQIQMLEERKFGGQKFIKHSQDFCSKHDPGKAYKEKIC